MTYGALNSVINSNLGSSSILGTNADNSTTTKVFNALQNSTDDEEQNFRTVLQNAISNTLSDTQNLIDNAEKAEIEFALGQADNTHDLMIAQNKAITAVNYIVAVRDRFLEAYKEIMNMQV